MDDRTTEWAFTWEIVAMSQRTTLNYVPGRVLRAQRSETCNTAALESRAPRWETKCPRRYDRSWRGNSTSVTHAEQTGFHFEGRQLGSGFQRPEEGKHASVVRNSSRGGNWRRSRSSEGVLEVSSAVLGCWTFLVFLSIRGRAQL